MKRILIVICAIVLSGCVIRTDPGHGRKVGRIVSLSKKGLIWKTWEGELIRGGFVDGSGSMGTSFRFTIEDDRLIDLAIECLDKQYEVALDFDVEFISSVSRSESYDPNFVKNITKM